MNVGENAAQRQLIYCHISIYSSSRVSVQAIMKEGAELDLA